MLKELLDFIIYKLKQIVTSRLFPVTALFALLFFLLFFRIYRLQVVEGEGAQQKVENIVSRTISLPPTRGNIYDRNGKLLAYNQLIQNVTVTDDGSYSNGYERNEMLLRLISYLRRQDENVVRTIDIYADEDGVLQEAFSSADAKLRFLRDMYGYSSTEQLSDKEKNTDAEGIFDFYKEKFGVGIRSDGTHYELDIRTAMDLIYIRYAMYAKFYVRYISTLAAENVKPETVALLREHAAELKGVDIEASYKRVYNDPEYLCHILGYTGYASTEEIERLNAQGGQYVSGDIIGKTGIEAGMELNLHGTAGSRSIYVNNLGQIQKVVSQVDPVAGDDLYLSIDLEIQKAIYHLLEQKLAGILINHLRNEDVDPGEEEHYIPIKKVYFQLINNNILDMGHFSAPDAGQAEKRIYSVFQKKQNEIINLIRRELIVSGAPAYRELSAEVQAFMTELYNVMLDGKIIIKDAVDTDNALYKAYRTEGSISLQSYLREALKQEWIDVTLLDMDIKYAGAEEIYQRLVEYVLERAKEAKTFSKALYQKLINDDLINRCDLALAMYEQGFLEPDPEYQANLNESSPALAFEFIKDKLTSIEITPAQLALDPFSASATVVDIATGKVLAMASYPGYDNNRIGESRYYASLAEDLSTPFFNVATQARTAPGSIFKMVTSAAVLEEDIISPNTYISTHGAFSAAGMTVECWYYPNAHGDITVSDALMVSCNDFFAQMAYRLSQKNEAYNDSQGVEKLSHYARLLGLGEKSGIEIAESNPVISDTSALTSAIGQGTNLFSCIHLARYATALGSRGNIYNLTLLDRRVGADGTQLQSYRGKLVSKTELKDSTWDAIWDGMRRAVIGGSHSAVHSHKVDVAGKTGTAEENELRPDHATYVSFAPFEKPEISVSVTIPNGYTSGNTAELGSYIYDYYYGFITYDEIMHGNARDAGGDNINE